MAFSIDKNKRLQVVEVLLEGFEYTSSDFSVKQNTLVVAELLRPNSLIQIFHSFNYSSQLFDAIVLKEMYSIGCGKNGVV